jgi:acyl carrier protein
LSLADELIQFLCEQFRLDRSEVQGDIPLFSSSLLDSVHMVEVIAFLEARTGVVFEADELSLDNFDTVSLMVSYCESRLT